MSYLEATDQYSAALKLGQKYYKDAISHGENPYPIVLDDIVSEDGISSYENLGLINVPAELIVGTKAAGRTAALAGNFMPLLELDSEFSLKWTSLCSAHLGDEGIRDPIRCFEYLGKFYVQEGNKRVSVLKSYGASVIPGYVTRLVPNPSEDLQIKAYYAFMNFYSLSGLYGIDFPYPDEYPHLQAALGLDKDHVWSERERRSFNAGFSHFKKAFDALNTDHLPVSPAEALLVWLKVFPFSEIKDSSLPTLIKKLNPLWGDIRRQHDHSIEATLTEPEADNRNMITRLLSVARPSHLNIAFIYAYTIDESAWTRAHDHGRNYLETQLKEKISVQIYHATDGNYLSAMELAIKEGAQVIFATTPQMLDACRRVAALYPQIRILNCALSHPYAGVRLYYSRIFECKFIAGAIAGIMTENDRIGYIENYPIYGSPLAINAFALGVRMTNPRAKVLLRWSCLPGDALQELLDEGVTVISNRDATNPNNKHWALEWGTYLLHKNRSLTPLAVPCWDWGKFYEQVVLSIFNGTYDSHAKDKYYQYWWGLKTNVVNIQLSESLPIGVRKLVELLKNSISEGTLDPFLVPISDNHGIERSDGNTAFRPEELIHMDWLSDNVDGSIPSFDELNEKSKSVVRILGLYRHSISPEKAIMEQL